MIPPAAFPHCFSRMFFLFARPMTPSSEVGVPWADDINACTYRGAISRVSTKQHAIIIAPPSSQGTAQQPLSEGQPEGHADSLKVGFS
eukprot:1597585-Pyramimonas_sp.AAC.1